MDTKGNGLDRTNELLVQILGELGGIKKELVGVNSRLDSVETRLSRVEVEIREMRADIRQLNENMRLIAKFVGEEIQDIRRRLDALERKAA